MAQIMNFDRDTFFYSHPKIKVAALRSLYYYYRKPFTCNVCQKSFYGHTGYLNFTGARGTLTTLYQTL